MTTLALPLRSAAPIAVSRSAAHKLALALVWLTVASGAVVFSEPAPVDVLTMGLIVLLPVIGLVAISPALVGLLALIAGGGGRRRSWPRPTPPTSALAATHTARVALSLRRDLRARGLRGQAPGGARAADPQRLYVGGGRGRRHAALPAISISFPGRTS